ncbi:uncharacterized protein [Euphorbia lathyris]|uniref:uncharacterized protein n=1 Tax=Euphorbia lathyris TaxID=212925 RepID=UPI00331396A0
METLSSSVSTLNVPALHSSSRNLYPPSTSHHLHLLHSTPKSNSNSTKTLTQISSLNNVLNHPLNASQFSSPKPSPTLTHKNPATGYAAALINILQSNNYSLDSAVKDVRRFSRVLQEEGIVSILINPNLGEKEKGRVINEVGKIGKFNRFLVRLMKMLIEKKNNLGMVKQVLVEFQRICDELNGIEVVMVSTKKKMEEKEVFGIARRVQKISGAVQVKVRNLVDDNLNLPSFAF